MNMRIAKIGFAALVALSIPTVVVLGRGASEAGDGLSTAAERAQGTVPSSVGGGRPDGVGGPETAGPPDGVGKPEGVGRPEFAGKPENAGERKQNHGFFVSQAAQDTALTATSAEGVTNHGQAVRAVAQGSQGKPAGAGAGD